MSAAPPGQEGEAAISDLLYAFYGDDFTGSTDVLEQLAEGGVAAVLFLRTPDEDLRRRFPDVRAIGLASDSRSRAPVWMKEQLPDAFRALGEAPVVHYKTCSTFDSSPAIGSIGCALDLGLQRFGGPAAIVVGAPHLRRFVAFGNLFAAAGDGIVRIDRHPTMAHHPVTPMHEADLLRHLALQTATPIRLVTLEDLARGAAARIVGQTTAGALLFDGVSYADLAITGRLMRQHRIRFAVGSSGVTRALVLAWQAEGLAAPPVDVAHAAPVDRLLVMSGSCSPATARQIARAPRDGFAILRADVAALVAGESAAEDRLTEEGLARLRDGGRLVIHTAEGPLGGDGKAAGDRLGMALGRIALRLVRAAGLRRLLFAGGDTSSHGVARLGIDALRWAAPIERGAPLVRAHAADAAIDGLELVLKGGQVGGDDFFDKVRCGRAGPAAAP